MSYIDHNFEAAGFQPVSHDVRNPRQRRLLRAQMSNSFGTTSEIVIRNISDRGIGASMQGRTPEKDSEVIVILPNGQAIPGVVRWANKLAFGIETCEAIDLERLSEAVNEKHTVKGSGWEVRRLHQVPSGHMDPTRVRRV